MFVSDCVNIRPKVQDGYKHVAFANGTVTDVRTLAVVVAKPVCL